MAPRVVMHADLDYFYAQCEENLKPSIRGKPVVVCVYSGRTEESGVVSTCNYEARKYGVRAGIPIVRAKKLLERVEATFLPMNRPLYEEISDRIMEIPRGYADSYEKVGIDEAYLDVSSRTGGSFERAEEIAKEIKQQILHQEKITCSIGIGPNKLIAKIASDHKKPNGLTVITSDSVSQFLSELPVNRIPGVGKKVEEKLGQLQVMKISQLSALDRAILVRAFGNSLGTYLHQAARGQDDEPVKEREQSTQFSRIGTLKRNTREMPEILPLLEQLSNSVATKLVEKGMMCKSVGVVAILEDLTIHSRSKTIDSPMQDAGLIRDIAKNLVEEFLSSMPNAVLRRVGVKLSSLSKTSGQADITRFLDR